MVFFWVENLGFLGEGFEKKRKRKPRCVAVGGGDRKLNRKMPKWKVELIKGTFGWEHIKVCLVREEKKIEG